MNTKSAPSQHLRFRHSDFRKRWDSVLEKIAAEPRFPELIDKAEAEGRISKEKAAQLRGMLR